MAVKGNKLSSRLKIELDGGMKGDKQVIKSKTYGDVNLDATNEDLHSVGVQIANLQSLPLLLVKRLEEVELEEE